MKATIIGFRNYNFKSEKDGRQIEGTSLYLAKEKYGVTGMETFKTSVSKNLADRCGFWPETGAIVEVEYDDKGRLTGIFNT